MKKSFAVMTLLLAAIFVAPVVSAQDDAALSDPGASDPTLVAAAANPVQTIAPADVLKMMQDKSAIFALVDTQPVDGYAEGHIPSAINYPWVMRIKNFPIALPRNEMLVFYGSCPNDTSDMVAKLAQFGYFNVKIMDGGWYKWQALKYPTAGKGDDVPADPQVSQLTAAPNKSAKPVTR
ncbi:MAG: rhodanese-like domain-containing protein [Candidatus Acidiferrales bacterium]